MRAAIHAGLVANDVVAFHTERWAGAFRESATEVLGPDALSRTTVAAHPISIDPQEFEELASSPPVLEAERRLEEGRPERVVLRVDRTDPSKNVVRGVLAFERLLETAPEAVGRVGMRALLDPSRQTIPEYVTYLEEIRREIARVNERFGRDGWLPIDLRVQDDFAASVAAYKQFDVLLVNSVYDGLNLVAKEAPLVNERDGVAGALRATRARSRSSRTGSSRSSRSTSRARPPRCARRSRSTRMSAAGASRRSAAACASTTSSAGSTLSSPTSTPRPRANGLPRRGSLSACPCSRPASSYRSTRRPSPRSAACRSTPLEAVPEVVAEARLAQERWARSSWDDRRGAPAERLACAPGSPRRARRGS